MRQDNRHTLAQIEDIFTLDPITLEPRWRYAAHGRKVDVGTLPKDGRGALVKVDKRQYPLSHIVWMLIHRSWPPGKMRFLDGNNANIHPDNLLSYAGHGSHMYEGIGKW